ADCVLVAGTSARSGGLFRRQSVGSPEQILPRLIDVLPAGPAALVFGPEPSGLTDAEVTRCHHLIHIPTDPVYPALNLAQAVAICLYELRRLSLGEPGAAAAGGTAPAPFALQEHLLDRMLVLHLRSRFSGSCVSVSIHTNSLPPSWRKLNSTSTTWASRLPTFSLAPSLKLPIGVTRSTFSPSWLSVRLMPINHQAATPN